jgi:hypothetical protein
MSKKGAVAAKTAVLKRRTFTREFKLQVIREIEAGKTQAQACFFMRLDLCQSGMIAPPMMCAEWTKWFDDLRRRRQSD